MRKPGHLDAGGVWQAQGQEDKDPKEEQMCHARRQRGYKMWVYLILRATINPGGCETKVKPLGCQDHLTTTWIWFFYHKPVTF